MWSLRCSFLIGDVVISPRSLDARETELTKMHPGDQKPFRTDNIQQPRSRRRGEMRILIDAIDTSGRGIWISGKWTMSPQTNRFWPQDARR